MRQVTRAFFLKIVLPISTILALTSIAIACSSDYMIWMVRNRSADPLYRFVVREKVGYIDHEGKVVIPPTFQVWGNYGGEFHNGLLSAISDGKYIDAKGKQAFQAKFYRGWHFSDGLAAVLPDDHGKWGYIDVNGKFAIPPKFAAYPDGLVTSFSNGYAAIEVRERVGYIDKSGNFVIQPRFVRGSD